ncbi:5'-methylthioadenosine/adenosylhomocysteine nucleosidase [Spirochaeta cellobiosiphila]|uniref:5'-methylthioadenosine/adenosylhomocysteine nucleosidase n=1 Tax=Spirochaeta cellobiosiphila TaxID=504483 RepID=UPI00041EC01F|nr:5'-methylthioadenosine/adenosylhomocysteine nucleosidase [Spirochaeta cellobiosiphila]
MKDDTILIIGALSGEIKSLLLELEVKEKIQWKEFEWYVGVLCHKKVVIARSGVGKVLSTIVTQKLIDEYKPCAVLFTGIAGSLKSKYQMGDIIIGNSTMQHDIDATKFGYSKGHIPYTTYQVIPANEKLVLHAMTCEFDDVSLYQGLILSGDQFITEKENLLEFDGDCVDMESAAVALTCYINDVPHLVIRSISDNSDGKNFPNMKKFLPQVSHRSHMLVKHIINTIENDFIQ